MSDMLERAIIDAAALKEAATKNAETLVLEKYSGEIKKAVESLLEQEDLGAEMGAEMDAALDPAGDPSMSGAPAAESSVMEHIPLAATANVDEEVEIPLDKLLEEVTKLSETIRFNGDEILDEDLFESLEKEIYEDLDEDLDEALALDEDLDEDLDEGLEQLAEKLKVDVGEALAKRGWTGLPESHVHLAEEELLALEQDSEVREQKAAMRAAVKELNAVNEAVTKENKKLTKNLNKSSKYMTKLRDAVLTLEEKLDKVSLDNARLLYQNKALTSDSLNERQKEKLVEAVVNAETIEEAKVIFETLQDTVGSTSRKQQPNSLSEAVERSSSVILSARRDNPERQKTNPTLNRWKFLAGIDK